MNIPCMMHQTTHFTVTENRNKVERCNTYQRDIISTYNNNYRLIYHPH